MCARERNRYLTTAFVFLLAFSVIALLLVRSAWVMAQQYTWRMSVATSNTYDSAQTTINLYGAYDPNLNTAATSLTNSPIVPFEFSGKWSALQQTTTFIRAVGLYVLRDGVDNVANQWRIQYTLSGPGAGDASWVTIDSDGISGPNPTKGYATTALPNDTDYKSSLAVRTATQQQGLTDAELNIYDIRVEADWNPISGGSEPLRITTTSLPPGSQYASYDQLVQAVGGNKPYTWEIVSGALPPEFTYADTGDPNYDLRITYSGSSPFTTPGTYNFTLKVSDISSPTQTDQKALSIHIAGLAIVPAGPDLPPAVKNSPYLLTFSASGGSAPYFWCLVSGTLPPGLSFSPALPLCSVSTYNGPSITLSGTPTSSGVYAFRLKLADSSGEETPVENDYILQVSTGGVRILQPALRPMIKGVYYSNATYSLNAVNPAAYPISDVYQRMEAQNLTAVNALLGSQASPPVHPLWSSLGLAALGLSLANETLSAAAKTSNVYITGFIPVTWPGGNYSFSATVMDRQLTPPKSDLNSLTGIPLRVLERRTVLPKTPPSTVNESAGVAINLSGVTNADGLKVGDVLTTTAGTTFVASGVVAWYDPTSPAFLVVDHPDVAKWVTNNAVQGPAAGGFSATIISTPAPPKAVVAPAHPTFTVFGEGGAPSIQGGTMPNGKQVPYYNYDWKVVPVGNSPALRDSEATSFSPPLSFASPVPPDAAPVASPYNKTISFIDTNNVPVTGTYDVTFWARDVLTRTPPDTQDYTFKPLTVRVNVVMPAGLEQRVGRPTKLRQEQFK